MSSKFSEFLERRQRVPASGELINVFNRMDIKELNNKRPIDYEKDIELNYVDRRIILGDNTIKKLQELYDIAHHKANFLLMKKYKTIMDELNKKYYSKCWKWRGHLSRINKSSQCTKKNKLKIVEALDIMPDFKSPDDEEVSLGGQNTRAKRVKRVKSKKTKTKRRR